MLIKYFLSKVNDFYSKTQEQLIDFANTNLEHILPKNPRKDWKLSKKEIKPYVNKVGNLTPLWKVINSRIQNGLVKDKVNDYKESELPLNKQLIQELTEHKYRWGKDQIEKRQEFFADLAYHKIFNF